MNSFTVQRSREPPGRASSGTELRPPILSRRFFNAWLAAFEAAPGAAIAALWQLTLGRKLRTWNLLSAAATKSPNYYRRWVAGTEPTLIQRWCEGVTAPLIAADFAVVVLANEEEEQAAVNATRCSIQAAFGPLVPIRLVVGNRLKDLLEPGAAPAGGYRLFIRAGDRLAPRLGEVLSAALARHPGAGLYYWDEDCQPGEVRQTPWIKPDWDELLFTAHGGLVGASLVSLECLATSLIGQDLDTAVDTCGLEAVLREVAQHAGAQHIPLILTQRGTAAARPAIPPRPVDPVHWPTVSIIIPTRDKPELLRACLAALKQIDYPGGVERIFVDNGSVDPAALRLLDEAAETPGFSVLSMPGPFNYSRLNNAAARVAAGSLLCLMNNDVDPLEHTWLTTMVRHAVQPQAGAVGALLLYPDRTVQHAGVAIGLGGAAGHVQRGIALDELEHRCWAFSTRQVSAVTAACLVVSKAKFFDAGGLDEENLAVAFNDVDLCLKLQAQGWRNTFVAEACLIHHESKSRGLDDSPEKAARFQAELKFLQKKWGTQHYRDPFFSPLFLRSSERCVLAY